MYIAKNNALAQLAGALGAGDLTANLAAGKGALFAVTAPEYTYATLFDAAGNIEHVKVTARATDALTIVRAQDGTAARAWSVGDYIECRPIAAALADYAVAPQINTATAETSIDDADEVGFVDASASNALKKITWANVKATLKAYLDTLYRAVTGDVTLVAGAKVVFEGTTDDAYETTLSAGDPTADRTITLPDRSGTAKVMARGNDIASAATVNLNAATGDIVDVTGTTDITAITLADGIEQSVRFTGILTLTNGASLVLPGGVDIDTAADDFAVFRGYAAGVVRCVSYDRASGLPVVEPAAAAITLATPQDTTSGTSIDFSSIPAGTKRITAILAGISTSGTSPLLLRFGTAGGIQTSTYEGASMGGQSGGGQSFTAWTNGIELAHSTGIGSAADILRGTVTFAILDSTNNIWGVTGIMYRSGGAASYNTVNGIITLSRAVTTVRLTTAGGADTFDAGSMNIAYE